MMVVVCALGPYGPPPPPTPASRARARRRREEEARGRYITGEISIEELEARLGQLLRDEDQEPPRLLIPGRARGGTDAQTG